MNKILKYKLIHALEDKKIKFIFLLYIIIFNYTLLMNSGLLTIGSGSFNNSLKSSLILNNFIIISLTFGLIISIYLGSSIIGKDIEIKQMYILLTNIHNRSLYLFLSWVSMIILILLMQVVLLINLFCITSFLGVTINFNDLYVANKDILLNMIVLLTITSLFTVFLEGYLGSLMGLTSLVLFNIHTYSIIPLVNMPINLSENLKRILVNLSPLKDIQIQSIIENGQALLIKIPQPYIINNFTLYQLIFISILFLIMIYLFKTKDL